jgi:hypothetical protein
MTYVVAEAAPVHLARPMPVLGPTADPSYLNGYPMTVTDQDAAPGIIVDGGWTSFLWYGDGIVFNQEGPVLFSADGPVTLRITDDFCTGDRFRIYDNGVELVRPTFDVDVSGGNVRGPDMAFADPQWSSGIYALELAPGTHEIVVQVIENPWGMGRAYLRVDTATPLSAFDLDEVNSSINAVHGRDQFRFYGRWAAGVGSDGVEPALEDIVVWFGRHMEVLPAGAFSCNRLRCLYKSTGPGIVRVVITADAFVFEAIEVDLCPGQRWLPIGVWFGDEGAERSVRRYGTLSNPEP